MTSEILQKIEVDPLVLEAKKQKYKKLRKKLLLFSAAVFVFSLLLCLLGDFDALKCGITFFVAVVVVVAFFCFLHQKSKGERAFLGHIERIEEHREIVPQRGTGIFGGNHVRTAEVYQLLVAVTDEKGETRVMFYPPQYEKLLKVGDTLLLHTALPYPAHLSNLTSCICMHCGTMQDANSRTCINCGATLYNFYSVTK